MIGVLESIRVDPLTTANALIDVRLRGCQSRKCADQNPTRTGEQMVKYTVRPDLVKVPASVAERDRQERESIKRLLAQLSARQREFVETELANPDKQGSVVAVPNSQEVANLFATIYAIRDARAADARLAEQQEMAARSSAPLVIAVLPSTTKASFAVLMIRTPGARGAENILAVPQSALTPERLTQGLKLLSQSRRLHGDIPEKEVSAAIRDPATRITDAERAAANDILRNIAHATPRNIPGFGIVPSITVTVGPAAP